MDEFFNVPMNYIAGVAAGLTLLILLFVGFLGFRNPVMFKMGLRNIPRRKAQTTLIVLGLMLSTVIMTAAFGTGDTMNESISREIYDLGGEIDEIVEYNTEDFPAAEEQHKIPAELVGELETTFANDPDIYAFMALNTEILPVQNTRTRLNEAQARIVAWPADGVDQFGGLEDLDGKAVVPTGNQIVVNEELADQVNARVGDELLLFFEGEQAKVVVIGIAKNTVLTGTFSTLDRQGGAISMEYFAELTGQSDVVDLILVSNEGGVKGGVAHSEAATAKLEAALAGTPLQVDELKKDGLDEAELLASFFTTFFIIFGLFSIAAGVLLIFLIFVMLAAERKPEMGMARAVGAKRRQIVEAFLAEGMGYDLASALVGLFFGVLVVFGMVGLISYFAGDSLGLIIQVHVTPRSLLTSFCIGVIATFIVIFIASWRASRINIVAAIRDLPESREINPEGATWLGFLRGLLNGFVAFGIMVVSLVLALRFPAAAALFLLAAATGIVGPWIYVLRGSNFGASAEDRREGEGHPKWPWIMGALLPVIGWFLVLPGYALAMLLVRLTRDRRPSRVPTWLVFLGVVVAPLGVVLATLQDRARPIAWSVGFGTVGAVLGVIMVQWGLDSDSQFLFAGGISLLSFWVAITLRYFRIAERASFTAVSAALLAFWYVAPAGLLEPIVGELNGDFEMFFLSGMVMVTAGTFIVVYNADILLPAIGAFGSRFGRIVPAVKTAVAYPLTSRFRTGMTVMMIGLIMFSLIMFQTLNANFSRVFLSDDAKATWDDRVVVNSNNRVGGDGPGSNADGLRQALESAGADTSGIETIAEARVSEFFETEVKDADPDTNDDGSVDDFGSATVIGGDDTFLSDTVIEVEAKARGYATDADVYRALREQPNVVVASPGMFTFEGGPDAPEELADLGIRPKDGFEPQIITMRDPSSGKTTEWTLIAMLEDTSDVFFFGLLTSTETLLAAFPEASGQTFYLKVAEGTDSEDVADLVEASLVQASADSLDGLLDEQRRQQQGFLYLFQGFMGLGLLVGIAALGVIASRAVVERRQQIGMLRAIGYQRNMVALSFLFESSFIALSGILTGFVLAVSLSWVLFTSDNFDESASGAGFIVPWFSLLVICAVAFVASLVMTYFPARAASRVPVADALRYE